jgi:hypothetical protein
MSSITHIDGSAAHIDRRRLFLATALATRREKLLALMIAGVALVAFIALVPFVRVPLARMPAFIPSYEAALFFIDLITAVLLYDQSIRLRSVGILALASGYLFDALIIVPHALSFPGAFAPTGLLGAKEQTTAWLYVFWHGGFPLFVIAYAWLRHGETSGRPLWKLAGAGRAIVASVAGILTLVVALTVLATNGHDWLPVVMQGGDYSRLVSKGISPCVWALTLLAMVALWQPPQRVVDLWLMLVMWIWLYDIALSAVIGSTRFDLGFYAGRVFGLIAASFLLITLVVQMAQMYAGALGAAASAEQKVAELARMRARPKVGVAPARGEPTDAFIHRQNIARYRTLLESGTLDDAQRRSIERLLAEEEAKDKAGALPE